MYSTPDLKRGLKFFEAEYALNEPPIAVPISGCDVVRRDSRGSGCCVVRPFCDEAGSEECCCDGDDTKSITFH
jgi:hypothetical protein